MLLKRVNRLMSFSVRLILFCLIAGVLLLSCEKIRKSGPEKPSDIRCVEWFDGCNLCYVNEKEVVCTKRDCPPDQLSPAGCRKYEDGSGPVKDIPSGCLIWFDGCNRCVIEKDGKKTCTKLYCNIGMYRKPYCVEYRK